LKEEKEGTVTQTEPGKNRPPTTGQQTIVKALEKKSSRQRGMGEIVATTCGREAPRREEGG